MKKSFVFLVLMAFACMTATAEVLKKGEEFVKRLELEFDDQAKDDNVFITWELSGDWDKFDYSFSQGTLKENKYTIRAKDYKDFVDGNEGITLIVKGKSDTKAGDYTLSMRVTDVTEDLIFSKDVLNADFKISYVLPPPPPLWKRLLPYAIGLIALILLTSLVLHFSAKFPKGILQLGYDEVRLKGKKRISVREVLEKSNIQLAEGTDIVFVKKRFARFHGPCVKEINNCTLERDGSCLTKGSVIHLDEEIKGLKDVKGNDIIIRYC